MKRRKVLTSLLTLALLGALTGCDSSDYKEAMSLYEAGSYEEASAIFTELGDYQDSTDMITKCQYGVALNYLNAADYANAIELFEELGSFEDSEEMVKKCEYNIAVNYLNSKDYTNALNYFEKLGDYDNSKEMVSKCQYGLALACFDNKEYDKALTYFESLGNYENSADMIVKCQYGNAIELLNSKEYTKALEEFNKLGDYEDSQQYCQDVRWYMLYDFIEEAGRETDNTSVIKKDTVTEGVFSLIVTKGDKDHIVLSASKNNDQTASGAVLTRVNSCVLTLTRGTDTAEYILKDENNMTLGSYVVKGEASANGTISLDALSTNTKLPMTNYKFVSVDSLGRTTQQFGGNDTILEDTILQNSHALLAPLLRHTASTIEHFDLGVTMQDLGFTALQ